MHVISRQIAKNLVTLGVIASQVGGMASAATTVTITKTWLNDTPTYTIPGGQVYLDSFDTAFADGLYYAGVLSGTVDSESSTTNFFCMEVNEPVPAVPFTVTTYTETTISSPLLTDGDGTVLNDEQRCLLAGVYKALGVFTATRWFTEDTVQDLSGTTTDASKLTLAGGLTDSEAVAAQLVMWEIIHDFATLSRTNPVSMLSEGKLEWYNDKVSGNFVALDAGIASDFVTIANAAYSFCPVPEITSPVALLAGGLVFVRRRERRGSRLKKSSGSLNQ